MTMMTIKTVFSQMIRKTPQKYQKKYEQNLNMMNTVNQQMYMPE